MVLIIGMDIRTSRLWVLRVTFSVTCPGAGNHCSCRADVSIVIATGGKPGQLVLGVEVDGRADCIYGAGFVEPGGRFGGQQYRRLRRDRTSYRDQSPILTDSIDPPYGITTTLISLGYRR
jgi:hypothetical protein